MNKKNVVVESHCRGDFVCYDLNDKDQVNKIVCKPKGKLRARDEKQQVTILPGDIVEIEFDESDPKRGRIIRRLNGSKR